MKLPETIIENKIKKINELINNISKINQLSRNKFNFINNEEILKDYKDLENFKNIERFSIPIVGKISSGKSTFLNFF